MTSPTPHALPLTEPAADHPVRHPRREDFTATVRERGPRVLLVLAALWAVTTAVGLVLVHVIDDTAVVRWDERVVEYLADRRTPTWNTITGVGLVFSDTIPVAVVTIGAIAVLAWKTRDWVAPVFVALAVGGEKLVYLFASLAVGRDRPSVEPVGHVNATSSFPSGHVGSALTLWGALAVLAVWGGVVRGRAGRALLVVAVTAIVVLVSFSRTYRGVHHPFDVFAGVLIGGVCLTVAWWAVLATHPAPGTVREGHEPGRRSPVPAGRAASVGPS